MEYMCACLRTWKYLGDHNHDPGYIRFYIQEVWCHKGWVGRAQSPHSSRSTRQNLRENTVLDVKKGDGSKGQNYSRRTEDMDVTQDAKRTCLPTRLAVTTVAKVLTSM